MSSQQLCREYVCPKFIVFTERNLLVLFSLRSYTSIIHPYLQLYGICMMPLTREHGHGMVEDIATALNALVQPTGSMLLFINRNRECLATTIIDCVDDSHIKFLWMLGKMLGAGHPWRTLEPRCDRYDGVNSPAAPAPTTKTLFLTPSSTA